MIHLMAVASKLSTAVIHRIAATKNKNQSRQENLAAVVKTGIDFKQGVYMICGVMVLLGSCVILYAAYDDPFYDYRGQNSFRESQPYQPEERFDAFTGNFSLIYTDIYLPGNGGLDLKIMRVYNSDIRTHFEGAWVFVPDSWVGLGWSLHMGRLIDPVELDVYYILEMPDGSKHQFYTDKNNPGQWISKEYWILKDTGSNWEVIFTNGVKWTFYKNVYGKIPDTSPGGKIYYYPTKVINDPCGNQISISYQMINDQTPITQIVDACDRIIHFNYETTGMMNLNSIEVNNHYYYYEYDDIGSGYSLLRRVRLPPDETYNTYEYDYTTTPLVYELLNAWNQYCGRTQYTFTNREIESRLYRVLSQRNTSPDGGNWSITYNTTTNNYDSTAVTDPYGTKTSYVFWLFRFYSG